MAIYSNDFEHLNVGDKPANVTYQYNTSTDGIVDDGGNKVLKLTGSSGNGSDLVTKISDTALPDVTVIEGRMYLEPVANPDQFGGWTSDELGELSSNLAGFAVKQYGDAGAQQARIVVFYRPADDTYYAYTQNPAGTDVYAPISTGDWIDMKFVTDFGNNQVTVFINDVDIGTVQTLSMSSGDASKWGTEPAVKYNGGNSTSTTTYFDDVVVTAAQPDLTYQDDLVHDTSLDFGQDLVIDLLVGNAGDTAAAAITTFYWSYDDALSSDDTVITTFDHGEIAGGDEVDSQDIEIAYEKLAAKGDGYLIPVLDRAGLVTESDETNNTGRAIALEIDGCAEVLFHEDFEDYQAWDRTLFGTPSDDNSFDIIDADGNSYMQATIVDSWPTFADYLVSPTFDTLTDHDSWELTFDLYLDDPQQGVYPRIGFINGETTIQYDVEAPAEGIMVRARTMPDQQELYYASWDHVADTGSGLTYSDAAYVADSWYSFTLTNDAATGVVTVIVENEDGSLFDQNSFQLVDGLEFDRVMFGDYEGLEAQLIGNTEILGVDNITVTRVTEICHDAPDLQVTAIDVEDAHLSIGEDMFAYVSVLNDGLSDAEAVETTVYWSPTESFDADTAQALRTFGQGKVDAGDTEEDGGRIRYEDIAVFGDGYLIARVDPEDTVTETNEDNNVSSAVAISVEVAGPATKPDLTYSNFTLSETDLGHSGKVTATIEVENQGADRAYAKTTYFYSTDDVFDDADIRIAADGHGSLDAGGSDNDSKKLKVKKIAAAAEAHADQTGDHYILAVVDAPDKVDESNETNNVASVEVTIGDPGQADLTFVDLAVTDTSLDYGQKLEFQVTAINQGTAAGKGRTEYFLSEDAVLDDSDLRLRADGHGKLDAGESDAGPVRKLNYKKIAGFLEDGCRCALIKENRG